MNSRIHNFSNRFRKILLVVNLLLLVTVNVYAEDISEIKRSYEPLKIISREEWGSQLINNLKTHQKVRYITIHHSGEIFSIDKHVPSYLKNLQTWSIKEKHWIDIPYHFVIDLEGKIYQARPINIPGDTNTKYNPEGHLLINVLGNYEAQKVNKQQLNSLANLIAVKAVKYNVSSKNIATHKDYAEGTVCPGKDLYRYFSNGELFNLIDEYRKN